MESAFDAQNLISISLRKIQSSRTQRGGIKLHKNLLVTYVLRNARQLCMSRNLSHQYEAAAAVRAGHEHLELTGGFPDLADDFYCNFAGLESDGEPAEAQQEAAALPPGDSELLAPDACWSCADKPSWESPVPSAQVSQKTVLDLDTHVVTTVTNGYLHPDCCCAHSRGRKRRMELHVVEPDFYLPDLGPVPCKRMRTDEDADSSNLCTLVSVLGSGGLCEFVSWQQTELEQILSPQTVALKHTLLTGWTRAIEAF